MLRTRRVSTVRIVLPGQTIIGGVFRLSFPKPDGGPPDISFRYRSQDGKIDLGADTPRQALKMGLRRQLNREIDDEEPI